MIEELKYKITKFDEENKLIDVVFEDGAWAQIRLVDPIPESIEALEKIIKTFAAPVEYLKAKENTSVDLSYINACIGVERACQRFSIATVIAKDLQNAQENSEALQLTVRQVLMEEGLIK